MAIPGIFPPSDLLEKVEGVEKGLRQRRRIGFLGITVAAVQTAVLVANSDWLGKILSFNWGDLGGSTGIALGATFVLALGLLTVVWARYYLRESTNSFRYTYSVASFDPVATTQPQDPLRYLPTDLSKTLSQRIGRLSQRTESEENREDAKSGKPGADAGDASHIQIRGYYTLRTTREPGQNSLILEITPWVRIGSTTAPERLARTVALKVTEPQAAGELPRAIYDQALESVYFSVATEIYKQLRADVARKIDLLPSRYFRATAYLHEADDYAHSNTLDAYVEATELYAEALRLFDPLARPSPQGWILRPIHFVRRRLAAIVRWLRIIGSKALPRLGRRDVMAARAEVGLAEMLLSRRALAGLNATRMNTIFEARPLAECAVKRLRFLNDDVPTKVATEFNARVTLSHAWYSLGAPPRGRAELARARSMDPQRAENDAHYAYVHGALAKDLETRALRLRRAAELDPQSEIVQFDLAITMEFLWRTKQALARAASDRVLAEYERVLQINPGNVGARANRGYIYWLRGDLGKAKEEFDRGREFKDIKRETIVAELDFGLARIAAEEGRFDDALLSFADTVAASLGSGTQFDETSPESYYFEYIDMTLWGRYRDYRRAVDDHASAAPVASAKVVQAFVLTDYGQACGAVGERLGDPAQTQAATDAYREAAALDASNVLARYYLANSTGEKEDIDSLIALTPEWVEATLLHFRRLMDTARDLFETATMLRKEERAAKRRWSAALAWNVGSRRRKRAEPSEKLWKDAERRAENSLDEACEARRDARTCLRQLLPHDWLGWRPSKYGDRLPARAFRKRRWRRQRTWEQSISAVQAEALTSWALRLGEYSPVTARWLTGWGRRPRATQRDITTLLLGHVARCFRPDHYMLTVQLLPRLPSLKAAAMAESMRELIDGVIGLDPVSYYYLSLEARPLLCRDLANAHGKASIVEKPVYSLGARRRALEAALHATPGRELPFGSIQVVLLRLIQLSADAQTVLDTDWTFETWRSAVISLRKQRERLLELSRLAPDAGALQAFRGHTKMARFNASTPWMEDVVEIGWQDYIRQLTHEAETASADLPALLDSVVARAERTGAPADLLTLANNLLAARMWHYALHFAELAHRKLAGRLQPPYPDACALAVGRAAWGAGKAERALSAFEDLTPEGRGLDRGWRTSTLETLLADRTPNWDEIPCIQSWLRRDQILGTAENRLDAGQALLLLSGALKGESQAPLPDVSRLDLSLEVGAKAEDSAPEVASAVWEAVALSIGPVPELKVQRSATLGSDEIRLLVNGLAVSTVALSATSGANGRDGEDGVRLSAAGASLAYVARRHAAASLDLDSVDHLLSRSAISLVDLPDAQRVKLVEMCRELVRDGVPLASRIGEIYQAWIAARPTNDLAAIKRQIRMVTRRYLPGNEPETFRLWLDPAIERSIANLGSAPAGSDEADRIGRRLAVWLRGQRSQWGLADDRTRPLALVVRNADTWPELARLVDEHRLNVPVLAEEEVEARHTITRADLTFLPEDMLA